MRLLLVEISSSDQRRARIGVGLGYIAAYVSRAIPEVEVQIIKGYPAWIEQKVKEYKPDIVGISTVSQYYDMAVKAADICHRLGSFVVIGGHHVSALPNSMTSSMDVGVIGEGENTMLEICRVFLDKGGERSAFADIPGVALSNGPGRPYLSEPRALHKPLDDLPFPARNLMHICRGESVDILTSRGCPYQCVFCAAGAFWKSVRFHSAEYVVAEIKEVVERYGSTRPIYFLDDLFVADLERVRKIAELIQQEPLLRGVKFSCTCRANLAHEELARVLAAMNVIEVMFGFESMSPDTLRYLKPHVTVEDNQRAVDVFHRHGVNVIGFFVIGSPKETRREIEQTLAFARTAPLHRIEAYFLTPLPGTTVWQYALERGILDETDVPWERLYIDRPDDPVNGVHLSETTSLEDLRGYLRKFERTRKAKDFANLIRSIPQRVCRLAKSPGEELRINVKRLRTRIQGRI